MSPAMSVSLIAGSLQSSGLNFGIAVNETESVRRTETGVVEMGVAPTNPVERYNGFTDRRA